MNRIDTSSIPTGMTEADWSREVTNQLTRLRRAHSLVAQLTDVLSGPPSTSTQPLQGADQITEMYRVLCRDARTTVRECYRPPFVLDDLSGCDGSEGRRARDRGVQFRYLVDTGVMAIPGGPELVVDRGVAAGVEQRLQARLPFKMLISDDRCAMIGLPDRSMAPAALIVSPSLLLDTLTATFESLWTLATPLVDRHEGRPHPVVGDDHGLLALLAGGATDEAIGRHMHLSTRTVNRRITRLLKELGAANRFQAGMKATRKGLI